MSAIADAFRKTDRMRFLIECDFNGLVDRISTGPANFEDIRFDDKILNTPSLSTSFDLSNFRYAISGMQIERANDDRFQDNERLRVLDGGLCRVWAWCPGLSWDDIKTAGCIFCGTFEKEYHTKRKYVFRINDLRATLGVLPEATITSATWANHRTIGGGGSVAGIAGQVIFGQWTSGVPLQCVDTTTYVYLAAYGVSSSADADYTAGTVNVYDKDGNVIAASNYTFANGVDSAGNPCCYFTFTGDQVANEPLSCSIYGVADIGGEYADEGDVIEHPADIAPYVMSKIIGYSPSWIDAGSIKALKTRLPGVRYTSVIASDTLAVNYLQRLFYQVQAAMVPRAGGKVGVMTFDNYANTKGRIIRDHHLVNAMPQITRTPRKLICNHLTIKYGYMPSSGMYSGQTIIDRTNNLSCNLSYHQYGMEYKKTILCPDICAESDALLIGTRYLMIFAFRHDLITLGIRWADGFDYREGDAVIMELEELPAPENENQTTKCVLIEKTYTAKWIKQTWFKFDVKDTWAAQVGMAMFYDSNDSMFEETADSEWFRSN